MQFLSSLFSIIPRCTFPVWFLIWNGSNEILKLGRSSKGYKKLKKSMSIWQRLFKWNYISLSKAAIRYQWYFVILIYLGYFCLIALVVIWLISLPNNNFSKLIEPYYYIKGYLIEFPALIFTLFNTVRPYDKVGVEWRFTRDYNKHKH